MPRWTIQLDDSADVAKRRLENQGDAGLGPSFSLVAVTTVYFFGASAGEGLLRFSPFAEEAFFSLGDFLVDS